MFERVNLYCLIDIYIIVENKRYKTVLYFYDMDMDILK